MFPFDEGKFFCFYGRQVRWCMAKWLPLYAFMPQQARPHRPKRLQGLPSVALPLLRAVGFPAASYPLPSGGMGRVVGFKAKKAIENST